ncbi:6-carboxytetrahydropterin synthase [Kocuria sp. SM24M-10]|uniref:6-pyruvoyl trahydropterin synthase family protein n=1 Tax=Kocuria sp. SM24M-10 TaxID=1660349 RepID=UPI00064A4B4B|nr:6-carboxytetrahydropterin synthase [Kocuria sp. SM24M-10]KLU11459.1 6-pyruvoyl tetrahydrobiopterin synthase [Kocuria sp. SM24M-10]
MFTLTVRDHIMIAHSLPDPFFGPAQNLHGATFTVETTWARPVLDEHGVVLDIGVASQLLSGVLDGLRYRNLDEHPDFTGRLSTTEVLAQYIAERLAAGAAGIAGLDRLTVTLRENPDAWASYTLELPVLTERGGPTPR